MASDLQAAFMNTGELHESNDRLSFRNLALLADDTVSDCESPLEDFTHTHLEKEAGEVHFDFRPYAEIIWIRFSKRRPQKALIPTTHKPTLYTTPK